MAASTAAACSKACWEPLQRDSIQPHPDRKKWSSRRERGSENTLKAKPVRYTATVIAVCAVMVAGCRSTAPTPDKIASPAAHALARTVGQSIGRCWFGPGETAFAGYIYSPEPNAVVPRVLIVRKDQPAERPVLVVEATGAASVTTYGPLMQSQNGGRIQSDLDRWAKGGTSCS